MCNLLGVKNSRVIAAVVVMTLLLVYLRVKHGGPETIATRNAVRAWQESVESFTPRADAEAVVRDLRAHIAQIEAIDLKEAPQDVRDAFDAYLTASRDFLAWAQTVGNELDETAQAEADEHQRRIREAIAAIHAAAAAHGVEVTP